MYVIMHLKGVGEMKKKLDLLAIGIINVLAFIPAFPIAGVWTLLCVGVCWVICGNTDAPLWLMIPSIFLAPAFQLFGIVLGIKRRTERHSVLCIILSVIGLFLYIAAFAFLAYISSID